MLITFSSRRLSVLPSVEDVLAAAAGDFDAVELTIDDEGPLRFDTSLSECRELACRAAEAGVRITSLATPAFWKSNYADADEGRRRRARDITLCMLERGTALGVDSIIVMPAVVGTAADASPRVGYADAMGRSFEALCGLRGECEALGVTLAVTNADNRFLLSPLEFAELLDRVNSGYLGACLDLDALGSIGYAADWIQILGGRLKYVRASEVERLVAGGAARLALERIGYDGPLVYAGAGDSREACHRWRNKVTK